MSHAKDHQTPPPSLAFINLSFPASHVVLITLNRPEMLNAMNDILEAEINQSLRWFENDPGLWVAILTGAGRAFCAGRDLKSWNNDQKSGKQDEANVLISSENGFGSVSRRRSPKPIIAAVHGAAMGGGFEMVLNCDLVIAAEGAKFAFPEALRGVVAAAGGIPRLVRVAGHQLASELLLTGRTVSALEGRDRFRFVNAVVPQSQLIATAVEYASRIVVASPDAVLSTKDGLLKAQDFGSMEEIFRAHVAGEKSQNVYKGENIKEGLRAFAEKRSPRWANPKL
ncbi:hypothetical protein BOTBODRAFT_159123 [Botryobasidium botryosum FD-172 SS1]|uniref:Enoyl-CoA hydratase n=1 Tax=Botryobasidium botryosum (strain FD-172 SS1) TaxID=930990 RepID=A0A067MSX5_BOTB1|nr:hypothetical protein BOTBODRAFT_159123 [Botryobasidium botryosum FD-172 SS1]